MDQTLNVEYSDDILIVELLDTEIEDDNKTVVRISNALFNLVDEDQPTRIVLDFSRVQYHSSIIFGTLIRLKKRLIAKGGALTICCIKPVMYEIYTCCKLDLILDIYQTRRQALDNITGPLT